ncbi:uncharacterized protein LOC110945003 [Helianthus annuus]|uniref:uncharacterized protein LOC110945003 n=1 Tax=Helianthus annuus TaxID=4232 RepID=UPI001652BB2A|nr:uncharacterized protein LOC110945003 [Helianthus annuus]
MEVRSWIISLGEEMGNNENLYCEKDEKWQEVTARRKGGNNQHEENTKRQDLTKFYIANIPERCSGDDIRRFLEIYGEIEGIYVARKRNKMGQRFAFVSFAKVIDKYDLEKNLRKTKIGDNKLFVSIAKFVDGESVGSDYKNAKQTDNRKEIPKMFWKDEKWQEVTARRKGGNNQHEENTKRQDLTKFYIANIPERCSGDDIRRFLEIYGEIEGIYVARKRNKMGQRFAFVSFAKVIDKYDLEKNLRKTKIGDNKLFVSIAKFVDGESVGSDYKNAKQTDNRKEIPKNIEKNDQEIKLTMEQGGSVHGIGTSFRDILTKNVSIKDADMIALAPNINAFNQWHDKTIVGRVLDFQKLVSLRRWLREKELRNIKIKYIGGTSVLLVFDSVNEAETFAGNELKGLRQEIERALKSGKLSHLVKNVRKETRQLQRHDEGNHKKVRRLETHMVNGPRYSAKEKGKRPYEPSW